MEKSHLLSMDELVQLSFRWGKAAKESDHELLPVFSDEEKQLGVAPRLLCHRLGLIHKVVYLFISNEKKELLIQIRGDSGRIDVPVGGHVSANDNSEKNALIRETYEELGYKTNNDEIIYLLTYFRESEFNLKKPEESNRELRVLYSLVLNNETEKMLNDGFLSRIEKKAVVDIKWMTINEIIKYCDASLAADGLKGSLPHYLRMGMK
jgi:isopentenyldiphosphate isomerase